MNILIHNYINAMQPKLRLFPHCKYYMKWLWKRHSYLIKSKCKVLQF